MTNKTKAYSYIRFSTDIQLKGDSLRRQKEASQNYAIENDLDLVERYEDLGVSGFKEKQKDGALGLFINAVKDGQIPPGSYLLIEEFDRLSRQTPIDAQRQFLELLALKIFIVTLADREVFSYENVADNPHKLLLSLCKMMAANDESKKKSERLCAKYENKRNNANEVKMTSMCPKWLTLDKENNRFIEKPELVACVKKIFELSIQGNGSYSIWTLFNKNPELYPPLNKSTGWHESYIQKILVNKSVFGEFQAHKMSVDGKRVPITDPIQNYFPVIVSKEDFDLSQARRQQRRQNGAGRKGAGFGNVFTRIIKCSGCKGTITFLNKGDQQYLICGNASRKKCSAPAWSYTAFESDFFKYISEINFDEIFTSDESIAYRKYLVDDLDRLEMKIASDQTEYEKIIERAGSAPENIVADLFKLAGSKKEDMAISENKISEIKNSLATINQDVAAKQLKQDIFNYYNLIENKSNDEIRVIRQKIHHAIQKIIHKIEFHNFDFYVGGEDIAEFPGEKFVAALVKRRYGSLKKQEEYLMTDSGQRFFNEYTRMFYVYFKNGEARFVQPSKDFNWKVNAPGRRSGSSLIKSDTVDAIDSTHIG